jgi:solute:Na+ symporter, SSS family
VAAYLIALELKDKQGIFEIAVRYAFSGFAAMAPVMVAALFWRRSTKWGALASTLFVAACLIGFAILQNTHKPGDVIWQLGQGKEAIKVLFLNPRGDVSFWNGFMTVVPMVFGSALCMIAGSLLTPPPSRATIEKYFPANHLTSANA